MLQLVFTAVLVGLASAHSHNTTGTNNTTSAHNSTGTSGGYYDNTQTYYDAYNGTTSHDNNATGYGNATHNATLLEARIARIVATPLVTQLWEAVKDVMSEITVNETATESENVTKAELVDFMTEGFKLHQDTSWLPGQLFAKVHLMVNRLLLYVDTNYDDQISLDEVVRLLIDMDVLPVHKSSNHTSTAQTKKKTHHSKSHAKHHKGQA